MEPLGSPMEFSLHRPAFPWRRRLRRPRLLQTRSDYSLGAIAQPRLAMVCGNGACFARRIDHKEGPGARNPRITLYYAFINLDAQAGTARYHQIAMVQIERVLLDIVRQRDR